MKAAGGTYTASMQHSGLDYNASALTGSKQLTRQHTVETSGPPGKRRRVYVKITDQHHNINASANHHENDVYDQHLLANQGDQRLVGLSMKLGSRLGRVDHYGPFLSNLNQNGRVASSWNGTMIATQDNRHVHMQIFRHRLSTDGDTYDTSNDPNGVGNVTQGPYPGTVGWDDDTPTDTGLPQVMFPQSKKNIKYMPDIDGPNPATALGSGGTKDNIKFAFYEHKLGETCFAPINRPDLEDMSWNLNKLKLAPYKYGQSAQDFVTAVTPVFQPKFHRRQSILQQNNFQLVSTKDLGPEAPTGRKILDPYTYKAVLRHGSVNYELMNKNDTGCTVEFIVYRVKKTANLSGDATSYSSAVTLIGQPSMQPGGEADATNTVSLQCFYPLNQLVDSVGQGYLNTVGDDYATENLEGRKPNRQDVYNNPSFPLLPKFKKTKEAQQPLVEVMRNKFAMSAGSRRSMKITFPGEIYNPCNIKLLQLPGSPENYDAVTHEDPVLINQGPFGPQLKSKFLPIADEYTYCVVLAVNGQKMTRFFDNKPNEGTSAIPAIPPIPEIVCSTGLGDLATYNYPPIPTGDPNGMPAYNDIGYWPCEIYGGGPGGNPNGMWSCGDEDYMVFLTSDNLGLQHSAAGYVNYLMVVPLGVIPTQENVALMRITVVTGPPPPSSSFYGYPCDCHARKWSLKFLTTSLVGGTYQRMRGCNFMKTRFPISPSWNGTWGQTRTHMVYRNTSPYNLTFFPSMPTLISRVSVGTIGPQSVNVRVANWTNDDYVTTAEIPGIPEIPAISAMPPEEMPMGDNHGHARVDYCATYTEHIGACLYDTPHERILYDCGQPNVPWLEEGKYKGDIATGSTTGSRMILPATSVVRQAQVYAASVSVPTSSAPDGVISNGSTSQATASTGGRNAGGPGGGLEL